MGLKFGTMAVMSKGGVALNEGMTPHVGRTWKSSWPS